MLQLCNNFLVRAYGSLGFRPVGRDLKLGMHEAFSLLELGRHVPPVQPSTYGLTVGTWQVEAA